MAAKEISVKKYVVRLSGEERERFETLIRKGKSPARCLGSWQRLRRACSRRANGQPLYHCGFFLSLPAPDSRTYGHPLGVCPSLSGLHPIIGSLPACCARATSGHSAAAPPSSVMNSRLKSASA